MKIAIITDTHFGARNNSGHMLDHMFNFFNETFFKYLISNSIDTVIHLGDLMDNRKNINYVVLDKVRREFLGFFDKENVNLHIIPGNHDVFFKNTNRINSLETLISSKNIKVYQEVTEISLGGLTAIMVPWINNENQSEFMKKVDASKCDYLMGHLELSGFDMHKGYTNTSGMDGNLFSKFNKVLSGHYHVQSSKGNIHYIGTPYQMSWNDYGETKGFHIIDTETKNLTFVKNPNSLFVKLYYESSDKFPNHADNAVVRVVVDGACDKKKLKQYIDDINDHNPYEIVIDDKMDLTTDVELDVSNHDTKSIISSYVNGMDIEHKDCVIKKLNTFYDEAISIGDFK